MKIYLLLKTSIHDEGESEIVRGYYDKAKAEDHVILADYESIELHNKLTEYINSDNFSEDEYDELDRQLGSELTIDPNCQSNSDDLVKYYIRECELI